MQVHWVVNIVLLLYWVMISYVTIYCVTQVYLLYHYCRHHRHPANFPGPKQISSLPSVTVQLPLYNEKYVAGRLIDSVCAIEYPRALLEIQILDDSTDETTEVIRQKVEDYSRAGVRILVIKRAERSGYKAGALAHGLRTATGEFIAIFDADFVPRKDFLMRTLPCFEDPLIGVVQTRWEHLNERHSILTRLQAFQLNVHFTVEQTGRAAAAIPLQFNGTAGVWRKEAILSSGGWQSDTLTEDLDLSYRAQLKGWRIRYLEEVSSPAELPAWMPGIRSQQYRWMKGGAETARKMLPRVWASSMELFPKIMATHHLLSSTIFIGVLSISLLSLPLLWYAPALGLDLRIFSFGLSGLIVLWLVYYAGNAKSSWAGSSILLNLGRSVLYLPVFLAMSMGLALHNSIAVLEGFSGRKTAFVRTPKSGQMTAGDPASRSAYQRAGIPRVVIFEGILSICFLAAVIQGVRSGVEGFLIFHLMLMSGYGALCLYSIKHARLSHL